MSVSRLSGLGDVILAWFPFLIAFVAIPLGIYASNQTEFGGDLNALWPFLVLGGLSLVALLALLRVKEPRRRVVARGLFFIGAFLVLSDVVAPLR